MTEREIYNQLKQMAINEAVAGFGKESIARNVGMQIDKIIDLALTLSASREGYKLVPLEPSEEMYSELSRHLCRYMQMHDRYCPKTLGKYISRFIGFKNIPDWLNKEVPDWESDHAFATADLGVFIYKAMIGVVDE